MHDRPRLAGARLDRAGVSPLRPPAVTDPRDRSVVVLVADGVRPDTLASALDSGELPTLAALRAAGGLHTVTTCFPSVTGLAYAPFLMGRYPGPLGLPGLRWFDRSRDACTWPDYTRSYVGHQIRALDHDMEASAPTLFQLVPESLGAMSVITRGLTPERTVGSLNLRSAVRAARTHFGGKVEGWLQVDREVSADVARRLRENRTRFAYVALTGVDKSSHARGHANAQVLEALRIVDATAAEIRSDAERAGRLDGLHLWIVSDHGHAHVGHHLDLVREIAMLGYRTMAHPWVFRLRPEVAVMVSGNAMSHVYLELSRRERPWWPELEPRWRELADDLLARDAMDLMLLPHSPRACEIRGRGRGRAMLEHDGRGPDSRFRYTRLDGDPLGIGEDVNVTAGESHELTMATDYPDSLVQIALLAGASRAGEMILSAAPGWDFRARFEPIPHVSAHGGLHRDHMLVPLLVDRPVTRTPRRTVDVMPSALAALGMTVPPGLDGDAFL